MTDTFVRDLETIPMTRGQLVQLLVRLYLAEGGPNATVAASEVLARQQVNATFAHLKVDIA